MPKSAIPAREAAKKPRARNARPKIERAALKLFIHEGVDAATTREIAEQAGVSEGALYRHYKGKDELALALFMETHNRLGKMMMEALAGRNHSQGRSGREGGDGARRDHAGRPEQDIQSPSRPTFAARRRIH